MIHWLSAKLVLVLLIFFSVFLPACEQRSEKKTEASIPVKQEILSVKIEYHEPIVAGSDKLNPVLTVSGSSRIEKSGLGPGVDETVKPSQTDQKEQAFLKSPPGTAIEPGGAGPADERTMSLSSTDAPSPEVKKRETLDGKNDTLLDNQAVTEPLPALGNAVALMLGETGKMVFYTGEGRIDPFEPLIKAEKELPVKENLEPDKPKRILTPLEKLDFSQISLVAIINSETDSVAMVQESSGKGYVVKIGTYMGQNGGQVDRIETDRIVIKEVVKNYKGVETTRFQELKLHKDKG